MPYSRSFFLRLEDADSNYFITNKAILELMENTADEASAQIGDDIMSLNARGLSWVIVEWNFEILNRPRYRDEITVQTWARDANNRYIWRDFEVFLGEQKIAVATSKWMLIELDEKQIVELDEQHLAAYQIEDREALPNPTRARLELDETYQNSAPIYMRKADFDLNNHVHNSTYLDYMQEVGLTEPRKIRMVFHREITQRDKVFVKSNISGELAHIAICNENNEAFFLAEQQK